MRDNDLQPNLDRILADVRAIDADVVAMQEVAIPLGLAKSSNEVEDGKSDGFDESMKSVLRWVVGDEPLESEEGTRFGQEMFKMGYEHVVYAPSFWSSQGARGVNGNAVFSRRPLQKHAAPANSTVTLDLDRTGSYPGFGTVGCTRNAAVAVISIGGEGTSLPITPVTVASIHLDVLAECGTYFGLAEGEFVRLLELENLNNAVKELPNVIIAGDCNAPAKSTTRCTSLNSRLGELLEQLSQSRDVFNQRHFVPGDNGAGPRLKEEWCLTALEFVEHRLGYRHAWQLLQQKSNLLPVYSHWSGQLIDHFLFRDATPTKSQPGSSIRCVTEFVGVFHSDASDHLPLICDIEFSAAS